MSVTPRSYDQGMANPSLVQHAGSRTALDIPSYLSGFFDGEGCFSISRSPRRKLRVGWEVRPSVSASQNEERSEVIRLAQASFGCGTIRRDTGDRTVKWEVRSLPVLLDRVNPHFRSWPMLSAKQHEFELFDDVCRRMEGGRSPRGEWTVRDRRDDIPDESERH